MVYRRNKCTWDVRILGKALEDLVNQSPLACAFCFFLCSRKVLRGFIAPVDP